MASYRQLINSASKKAREKDISDQTVKLLMLELCNNNSTDLYLNYENEVETALQQRFEQAMQRLLNNEPLQYILGYQWFCGYKIFVNEQCLIPRYETEELVGNILADSDYYFKDRASINIADIGTGSGAIAIALKKEEEKFNMWATDISETALQLAQQNSEYNKCNISFLLGDMLQPLIDNEIKLDILVSNPPYIPKSQKMEKSVVDFEPHVALFGGDDGLFFYRKIMENAHKVINPQSFLAFEIGYDEKAAICQLVEQYFPNDKYEVLKDLNGKDRMLFIYHNL
ncbi:MAG: peptide chain release factor N(5)-glutamine methyltransferase [Erysipelotrichaceae bacterium]